MSHSVAAIAVVVIVHVVPATQQREVLEIGGTAVGPGLEVVDVAILPRAVALGVGADEFGGRESELLPKGSGALGAAKLEGEALVVHGTEEIVLRAAEAEEIERESSMPVLVAKRVSPPIASSSSKVVATKKEPRPSEFFWVAER